MDFEAAVYMYKCVQNLMFCKCFDGYIGLELVLELELGLGIGLDGI